MILAIVGARQKWALWKLVLIFAGAFIYEVVGAAEVASVAHFVWMYVVYAICGCTGLWSGMMIGEPRGLFPSKRRPMWSIPEFYSLCKRTSSALEGL